MEQAEWKKRFQMMGLFDLYGALLTERQQKCMELYLFEDFSLSEIGEAFGISRQAVHDLIHRSAQAMDDYEKKLGLAVRRNEERAALREVYAKVSALKNEGNRATVDEALRCLFPYIGELQEE